jgi:hypothetical protein
MQSAKLGDRLPHVTRLKESDTGDSSRTSADAGLGVLQRDAAESEDWHSRTGGDLAPTDRCQSFDPNALFRSLAEDWTEDGEVGPMGFCVRNFLE